jgi:hypothetical protein
VFKTTSSVCLAYASGPSVDLDVRDQSGHARALGAIAEFYRDAAGQFTSTTSDTLEIQGGDYGQTYDIRVSAPYYLDTIVRSVKTSPGDGCGHAAGHGVAYMPYIDADAGVSRAVVWSISGDTAAVTLDRALGTLTYRCGAKNRTVILTATLVADSAFRDSAGISVQGHPIPNDAKDPPCSGIFR